MGRSDKKARKALKVKQTLDILRDRDRKTSSFKQLTPSDSETPPAQILRSNINSHELPARLPPGQLVPKHEHKKELRLRKQKDRIARRVNLMSTRSTDVFDLTHIDPDIDTDESMADQKLHAFQNSHQKFDVFFSLGFIGYTEQSGSQRRKLTLESIQSPPTFQKSVLPVLQYQLSKIGLSQKEVEILGYEILVPEVLTYRDVTVPAGQRVLIRSSNILVAWAEQVMTCDLKEGLEIVMRLVKKNGSMFDTAYRTPKEIMAEPVTPDDSIEPGMQDNQPVLNPTPILSKGQMKWARRVAAGGAARKAAKLDTLARRQEMIAKAKLRLDTRSIERLMARQQLSSDSTDRALTRASRPPVDVPPQSNKTTNTENDLLYVEAGMMELEMVG